ncbi:MAG TPA: peptidoglycan-binding domain-containing protein [Burkholderiales bacterium]|nr:peptidoglycan-binding domain-containing protein [Burkholderiales bacterium]
MKIRHIALIAALASSGMAFANGNHGAAANVTSSQYASSLQQSPSDQQVRDVQQMLKQQGFNPGPVDGIMGPRTEQALRSFQQARGLDTTGNVDAQTLSALGVQGGPGMNSNVGNTTGMNSNAGAAAGATSAGASASTPGSTGSSYNANTGTSSMSGSSDAGQNSMTSGTSTPPGALSGPGSSNTASTPNGSSYGGASNPSGATQPSTSPSTSSMSSPGMTQQSTQ